MPNFDLRNPIRANKWRQANQCAAWARQLNPAEHFPRLLAFRQAAANTKIVNRPSWQTKLRLKLIPKEPKEKDENIAQILAATVAQKQKQKQNRNQNQNRNTTSAEQNPTRRPVGLVQLGKLAAVWPTECVCV